MWVIESRPTARLAQTTEDVAQYLAEVQSHAQRGPVLTGVRDTVTGEMFFKQNVESLPSEIHPMLQCRLESYLADPELVLNPKWGVPGTHSDFLALNEALLRRQSLGLSINDLSEFEMYNVSLWSNRVGTTVPRCGNCQVLTDGVTVLSGR